jgi:hypothetical protein
VLPGGRNSGQKAQKGRGKKVGGWKNLWPNIGRILPTAAEKGPRKFSKEVPYCTVMANSQRQRQNLTLILIDPSDEVGIDVSVKLAELFPKLAEFLMYWPKHNFRTWRR